MSAIAVIVPVYNGEKWLKSTIQSVLSQTHTPAEIIVVDNNSTDSSIKIVQSFPNIKVINNSIQNANFSRQCGLKASSAQFIAYLDQDDIWHPDHLKHLFNLLQQYSNYPAAIASFVTFRSSNRLRFPEPIFREFEYNPWQLFPTNRIISPSTVMIRRTALESIGGWQTQFEFCGDIYTWLRLGVHHSFIHNKTITVGYRRHNTSQSATSLTKNTQKCFNSFFSALEDAFSYYSAASKPDCILLKKRLFALSKMSDIISSLVNFDRPQLRQSILVFEESLAEEEDRFVSSICGLLIWFLYGYLANRPFSLGYLLESLPQEAPRTRQAFQAIGSSRILPKRLLAEPFNRQLWLLLLRSLRQIIQKLPRYSQ